MTDSPEALAIIEQLADEIYRQDTKHGRTFAANTPLGRIRLGIACVEDETRELRDAWRDDRKVPVTVPD